MKYCDKCGFRTSDDTMVQCCCCQSALKSGEGNGARKVWEGTELQRSARSSRKLNVAQMVPRLILILIPLILLVALHVKGEDIQTALRQRQEDKKNEAISSAISLANEQAAAGEWDSALDSLSEVREKYADSTELEEAFTYLSNTRPVMLVELSYTNAEGVQMVDEEESDRMGNYYSFFARFDASAQAYAEYDVLGRYEQFIGEIHVPGATEDGKDMWIEVYADGELAYSQYNITENTEPKRFLIDLTGVTSMSIVTGNNGSQNLGFLDLAATYLGPFKEDYDALEEAVSAENGEAYIFPDSNSRYLEEGELEGFSADQCKIARNELYARYGRKFQDEGLQDYFNSLEWYSPSVEPEDFDEGWLNEYEVANRDLIVRYEEEHGYR